MKYSQKEATDEKKLLYSIQFQLFVVLLKVIINM